jgi:hypothetical protein
MKSAIVTLMGDEEGVQRKHKLLAAETNDYFWHTCPELTERWRQAMLTLPPSVLRDLAVELQGLEAVTNRANQELQAAYIGAIEGGEPIENLDLLQRPICQNPPFVSPVE